MVISSEFRMGQYRDDDHREDAPHFTYSLIHNTRDPFWLSEVSYTKGQEDLVGFILEKEKLFRLTEKIKTGRWWCE